MQQKRNQILINVSLTIFTLISSVILAHRNTLSTMQSLNVFKFSSRTLLLLSIIGVLFNFLLSMLINLNVYKVIFKLSNIEIESSHIYMLITISLVVSNTILLFLPQVKEVSELSVLIQNMLSYFWFIGLSIVHALIKKIPSKNIIKLCMYLFLFTLTINALSVLLAFNGGTEVLN